MQIHPHCNLWVIRIIAIALVLASSADTAQARIQKYISNMVASGSQIYLSEFGGKILIFDVEQKQVAAKLSVFGKHGRTDKATLFNDNGRVMAVGIFDDRLNRAFYEITSNKKAKKLAVISGRFKGFDNAHVYCSHLDKDASAIRYTPYRLDKAYQNPQAGHIRGYPHLMIQTQSEDADHYWFLCSRTDQVAGRYHRGFVLVRKDKQTGDIAVFSYKQEIKWIKAELATDAMSVWILLQYTAAGGNRLLQFDKQETRLADTRYLSALALIPNLDISNLPAWTYAGHESHQVFPLIRNAVRHGEAIDSKMLFLQHGDRQIPKLRGVWKPGERYVYRGTAQTPPPNISHVVKDYYGTSFSLACTYRGSLWMVVFTREQDGSIYHILNVPMGAGQLAAYRIEPTLDEKAAYMFTGIGDVFEVLGMFIFGE